MPSLSSCGWPITQEVSRLPAAVGDIVAVVGFMVVAGMAVGVEGKMAAAGTNDSNERCGHLSHKHSSSTGISTSPILE